MSGDLEIQLALNEDLNQLIYRLHMLSTMIEINRIQLEDVLLDWGAYDAAQIKNLASDLFARMKLND